MKYLGNTITGEVCAASRWNELIRTNKDFALFDGTAVEITGNQKGEDKAIFRMKSYSDGKYVFKAFNKRQWKEAKSYQKMGWEMRKDYDSKMTFDEKPFFSDNTSDNTSE